MLKEETAKKKNTEKVGNKKKHEFRTPLAERTSANKVAEPPIKLKNRQRVPLLPSPLSTVDTTSIYGCFNVLLHTIRKTQLALLGIFFVNFIYILFRFFHLR